VIRGRNHDTWTQHNLNSYLGETGYPTGKRNFLTGRLELVDKDELFADAPDLEAQLDRTVGSTFRLGAYTAGYTRDIPLFKDVDTRIGDRIYPPGSSQTVLRRAEGHQRLCVASTEAEPVIKEKT